MNHERATEKSDLLSSGRGIVLLGFLAVIGLFLFTEHRAHLFGILPYLLLLACPFMHFFMHGRHGDRHHNGGSGGQKVRR